MKHTLQKIGRTTLSIISGISHFMLLWLFVSTVEIAFTTTIGKKANDYNMFVISNNIKSALYSTNKNIDRSFYTDIITDNSDDIDDDTECMEKLKCKEV